MTEQILHSATCEKSFVTTLLGQPVVIGAGLCIVYQVCSQSFEYCTGFWQTLSQKAYAKTWKHYVGRYHIVDIFVIWMLVADLGALQRPGPDDVFHVLFVTTFMG